LRYRQIEAAMHTGKGWFKLPGIRDGDRSIEEQLLGLDLALAQAAGKTVLDLGCAEGAISREFAKAGATLVVGIELLETHLKFARKVCKGLPVEFIRANIMDHIEKVGEINQRFDIVLALSIIHKMDDPAIPLRFAARSCRDLLLYRASKHAVDGVTRSKHTHVLCDAHAVLREEGFEQLQSMKAVRGEVLEYWKRSAA